MVMCLDNRYAAVSLGETLFIDRCWCLSKTFHALVNLGPKEGATCFYSNRMRILDFGHLKIFQRDHIKKTRFYEGKYSSYSNA